MKIVFVSLQFRNLYDFDFPFPISPPYILSSLKSEMLQNKSFFCCCFLGTHMVRQKTLHFLVMFCKPDIILISLFCPNKCPQYYLFFLLLVIGVCSSVTLTSSNFSNSFLFRCLCFNFLSIT